MRPSSQLLRRRHRCRDLLRRTRPGSVPAADAVTNPARRALDLAGRRPRGRPPVRAFAGQFESPRTVDTAAGRSRRRDRRGRGRPLGGAAPAGWRRACARLACRCWPPRPVCRPGCRAPSTDAGVTTTPSRTPPGASWSAADGSLRRPGMDARRRTERGRPGLDRECGPADVRSARSRSRTAGPPRSVSPPTAGAVPAVDDGVVACGGTAAPATWSARLRPARRRFGGGRAPRRRPTSPLDACYRGGHRTPFAHTPHRHRENEFVRRREGPADAPFRGGSRITGGSRRCCSYSPWCGPGRGAVDYWHDRAPYSATAVGARIGTAGRDRSGQDGARSAGRAGPARHPPVSPRHPRLVVVGQVTFRTPRPRTSHGHYALFALDKFNGSAPVSMMWGSRPGRRSQRRPGVGRRLQQHRAPVSMAPHAGSSPSRSRTATPIRAWR